VVRRRANIEGREGPASPGGSLSHAWRALRHRNFQLFFVGQGVSVVGTWMTRPATAWLVYRLTDSALLLGMVGFAGQIISFALGPFAGVRVEGMDRLLCDGLFRRRSIGQPAGRGAGSRDRRAVHRHRNRRVLRLGFAMVHIRSAKDEGNYAIRLSRDGPAACGRDLSYCRLSGNGRGGSLVWRLRGSLHRLKQASRRSFDSG
jgi:Transmembrane secretion effector